MEFDAAMSENDALATGQSFHVTILEENGGNQSFVRGRFQRKNCIHFPRQVILAPWFFSATHYFIIEEIDDRKVRFIQRWKQTGLLSVLELIGILALKAHAEVPSALLRALRNQQQPDRAFHFVRNINVVTCC
jgi:hypothetical protein